MDARGCTSPATLEKIIAWFLSPVSSQYETELTLAASSSSSAEENMALGSEKRCDEMELPSVLQNPCVQFPVASKQESVFIYAVLPEKKYPK